MNTAVQIVLVGVGATLIMDLWCMIRRPLFHVPFPDYAMVGRWVAHMKRGHFVHNSIALATPIRGEGLVGWSCHYLVGIVFSFGLAATVGAQWFLHPSLMPALIWGAITVVAPFFLMQPGMGAGVAASKTKHPVQARLHSVVTHLIFGTGLYLVAFIFETLGLFARNAL